MPAAETWDFRTRLATLVERVPPPSGLSAWTNEGIAQEVRSQGVEVTANHIAHLRSGRRDNPSARLIGALAQVFGVPVDYFFDPARAETVNEQLAALSELRDAHVIGVEGRGSLDFTLVAQVVRALKMVESGETTDGLEGSPSGEGPRLPDSE